MRIRFRTWLTDFIDFHRRSLGAVTGMQWGLMALVLLYTTISMPAAARLFCNAILLYALALHLGGAQYWEGVWRKVLDETLDRLQENHMLRQMLLGAAEHEEETKH